MMLGERCPGSEDEPVPFTDNVRFNWRNRGNQRGSRTGTQVGKCRKCGGEYGLRVDGLVRKHNWVPEGNS